MVRSAIGRDAETGMTLIEILVVLVLIGIVMGIVGGNFLGQGEKAKGKADIHLVKVASLVGPEDQPNVQSRDLMSLFPSKPKSFLDLPLYDGRDKKARPSPEELLESAATAHGQKAGTLTPG